jgi:hypothetical protein
MKPSTSHGRLRRLVSSSLPRANPPITHITSASRPCCSASRGAALQYNQWQICFSRSNSRLYPRSTLHIARQAGCRLYSSTIEQAPRSPEMPDHLDSKEKAIFQKLLELNPVALEVSSHLGCLAYQADSAAGPNTDYSLGADSALGARC